jgi:hypothetical protein
VTRDRGTQLDQPVTGLKALALGGRRAHQLGRPGHEDRPQLGRMQQAAGGDA